MINKNVLIDLGVNWTRDQAGVILQVEAVTPHDTNDFTKGVARGIYVGVTGDVSFVDLEGETKLLKAAANGYHPIAMKRVRSTATTATNILALF